MKNASHVRWTPAERSFLARECLRLIAQKSGLPPEGVTPQLLVRFRRILVGQILREAQHTIFADNPSRMRLKAVTADCPWLYPMLEQMLGISSSDLPSQEGEDPQDEETTLIRASSKFLLEGVYATVRSHVRNRGLHRDHVRLQKTLGWLKSVLTAADAHVPLHLNSPRLPRGVRVQVLMIGFSVEAIQSLEESFDRFLDFRVFTPGLTQHPLRMLVQSSYLVMVFDPTEPLLRSGLLIPLSGHKLRICFRSIPFTQRLLEDLLPE